ncbi:4-hydroxy-tetrahydrodipicolinate synthase [PVC group bacterium (ex Bugula neritina AB1)]|nr:4-hydroxy-tetrahydrodipicolinate synthase [PVC group bacterium (ex Bugula neritina AB1)]
MFEKAIVALATPHKNEKIDWDALADLIEFQIENGTNGILPCGCTGEAATMNHDEQIDVIKFTVERVNKRVPVLAGSGSNNTAEAIDLTQRAKDVGADGALLITPYYNKPTQEGLYAHYKTIAEQVKIPIMLYNVPGRTAVKISPETVARLSKVPAIVAIKEACGSVDQVSKILSLCDITVLSGDDALTLPMMSVGAKGVVSVLSNIVPKDVADLTKAFHEGDLNTARDLHYKTLPLVDAMFIETNPLPVKTALFFMGKIKKEFRLPLLPMSSSNEAILKNLLEQHGVLS